MYYEEKELKALLDKEMDRQYEKLRQWKKRLLAWNRDEPKDSKYDGLPYWQVSISDIAASLGDRDEGGMPEGKTEALLFADIELCDMDSIPAPDRATQLSEALDIAIKTIIPGWSDEGIELFAKWLDAPSVAVLCDENGLDYDETLKLVKEMVTKCREAAGMNRAFPFPEEGNAISKRRAAKRSHDTMRRQIAGTETAADPESRVWITDEERRLPQSKLAALVKEKYGITVNLHTASRAKARGWFMRPGWKRKIAGEKFVLPDGERKCTAIVLQRKYGIAEKTAYIAKKTGFFWITGKNRTTVTKALQALQKEVTEPAREAA